MTINGIQLEFNHADVNHLKRLEAAEKKCQAAYKEAQKLESRGGMDNKIAGLQMYVDATRAFFDDVFGEGTAPKVFKDSGDAMLYIRSLTAFASEMQDQMVEDNEETVTEVKRMREKLARFQPQK